MDIQHCLHRALAPKNIAVLGASDRVGSLGTILWSSLISGQFQGKVYAVNPKYKYLGDTPCYASLKDIQEPIDLAIVATPPQKLETLLDEIAQKGIGWVVIPPSNPHVTSQQAWQAGVVNKAHRLGIRLIGTDCLGILRPDLSLNASYWTEMPAEGDIGFVSQSGVIGTSVLAYARESGLGFSSIINTGDEIDVSMSEVIDFLTQDKKTRTIVLHVEGVRNPREFFSAIRAASQHKPVIVLRGGKSMQSGHLLANRMAIPAGDDQVFNALLERAGAIRVHNLEELLAAIEAFSDRRQPRANRLGIICNGSGFGVLAADAASHAGVSLPSLSRSTIEKIQTLVDSPLPITNPVDLGANADPRRIKLALDALNQDENIDAVLVITAPSVMAPLDKVCDALIWSTASSYKPLFTAWIGEYETIGARKRLLEKRITALKSPEVAIQAFSWLSRYADNQRFQVTATPENDQPFPINTQAARDIISHALQANRFTLNEYETKKVLASIGLTTASGIIVHSPIEAVDAAKTLGMPVVLKVLADGIYHKSNVGGVALDLRSESEVYAASQRLIETVKAQAPYALIRGIYVQRLIKQTNGRELAIDIQTDPCFGPYVRFGFGGYIGEIYQDSAVELLPLTEPLAEQLIDAPKISRLLGQFRGMKAINRNALRNVLMRLSSLLTEIPAIRQLTIDPILIDEGGCIVLDANIGLTNAALARDETTSHMVISPEPTFDTTLHDLRKGRVTLRSVRPEDYEAVKNFIARLSPQTAYLRFHISNTDLAREKIVELTNLDYNREVAVAAQDYEYPEMIRAVARYKRINGSSTAEFGLVVEDSWQRRGLATLMMNALHEKARQNGITMLIGYVLRGNESMFALMESLGYTRIDGSDFDTQFITFVKKI